MIMLGMDGGVLTGEAGEAEQAVRKRRSKKKKSLRIESLKVADTFCHRLFIEWLA
jgi:hypothetical protein